jgi:peptide/nickel transport system permease protein
LGTASGGDDILYGIVWGSRTAFRIGIIVVCACALIGFFLGGLGAFIGGIADAIAVRVTNLFMSFPFLIAVIILSVLLGKGIDNVIIALIVFGWRSYARIMHSKVRSVKGQVFVTAAESIGAGKLRIFSRYILPNSICPVFILMLLDIGTMVLIATSLSFIGVGAKPGYADWGQMIYSSKDWLLGTMNEPFHYWYTYLFPFIAIFTFALGWNLLGETLRDVLDPKIQREPR